MFRYIGCRLGLFAGLLVALTAGATLLFAGGHPVWGVVASAGAACALWGLARSFKRINRSIVILLNAIENGDYSFHLPESRLSRNEREVNKLLNAIKQILLRAREEQIENEKFLSLIVAGIPVGIAIIDPRGHVRVANDAALRLLGIHVFTHLRQLATIDRGVMETFRTLPSGGTARLRITDEREERVVSLGCSEIAFRKGPLRVVTMHNIGSEIEADEMQSWIKLIRVMTHEIMNSIAPITSLSETMLEAWREGAPDADERARLERNTLEGLEAITQTARGLGSFVESYRRFTGIPTPQLREVELAPLVERVMGLEAPLFAARGIALRVDIGEGTLIAAIDEGQIAQVVVNLLKNAAEAVPATQTDGRVTVRLREVSKGAEKSEVHLTVEGNGTPIPAEVAPHIFVPFFTTKPGGTGIGLSVSRHIMRLHGGNLKHHTERGLTVFSVVFSGANKA